MCIMNGTLKVNANKTIKQPTHGIQSSFPIQKSNIQDLQFVFISFYHFVFDFCLLDIPY